MVKYIIKINCTGKKDLTFKYSQLLGENKKLEAENKVMEKAIE